MPRQLFDTSFLIDHWKTFPRDRELTEETASEWARKLIDTHRTNLICTPVLIEALAGTRNQAELRVWQAYLREFTLVDDRKIPSLDWEKAQQLAQRVPAQQFARGRQLGDCLIKAIADRMHCSVLASDKWFQ